MISRREGSAVVVQYLTLNLVTYCQMPALLLSNTSRNMGAWPLTTKKWHTVLAGLHHTLKKQR